ncbi:glycoside hydrolase family 2 protein [Marinimicrobium sp. ARAG 43.8]|uniref:glycoside hydrolase family 2 protein n=1 Tax=Marinimicrobium sp. ARAG 43.8 TaxID=3418719 RepID=UPI003CE6E57A
MKKITRSILGTVLFSTSLWVSAANVETFQAYTRPAVSLNGEWKTLIDPYDNGYYNYRYEPFDQMASPPRSAYFMDAKPRHPGELIEYDFDAAKTLAVPSDWNTQDDALFYYEGTIWYRKQFNAPKVEGKQRTFIHFGAANYRADVYLNGEKLGHHIGGFTPFYFEVTGKLKPQNNSLVVRVNNERHREAVPTVNTDWWNYGGITRSVRLIVTPGVFVRDYKIQLDDYQTGAISGYALVDGAGAGQEVRLSMPQLDLDLRAKTDANGVAQFQTQVSGIQYWSPGSPKMYQLSLRTGTDRLDDEVGLRTIATQGKQLLLNGKPLFLRGISLHEEYAVHGGGRVKSAEEARHQLQWAQSLGANFVRLAHYPHNEHIVRLADQLGIMLWSEIPVYWTIDWESEETYQNAETQLSEMIGRDKNRAAIIIWSLANETPVSDARNTFLTRLADQARALDSTRLISAAMEKHYEADNPEMAVVEDPLADLVDIVAFNQYIGWYDGLHEKADRVNWRIPYDKPVFISEFGAGAKQGRRGDSNTLWTEDYQAELYRKTLAMLDRIDGFVGTSPWILADFRSPRRMLPGIQDTFNRKGLLSETGVKKAAFDVLKDYYRQRARHPAQPASTEVETGEQSQ